MLEQETHPTAVGVLVLRYQCAKSGVSGGRRIGERWGRLLGEVVGGVA